MSPPSSDSDDFMSDKYLPAEPTTRAQTYTQRRHLAHARHLASQPKPRAVREAETRRAALETSLFDRKGGGEPQGKAVGMMLRMGWKPGEGLGKKPSEPNNRTRDRSRSASASASASASDDDAPRTGIGASRAKKRKLSPKSTGRTEPLRLSMWAGKLGLGAHQRSPSPENMSFLLRQTGASQPPPRGPGPALDDSAEAFRRRRAEVDDLRRVEGQEWAARRLLMEFDEAKGIHFHPLWIIPSAPLQTIPRPLLRLLDPSLEDKDLPDAPDPIRGFEPEDNISAAAQMREAMRRDALHDPSGSESDSESEPPTKKPKPTSDAEPEVDWESYLPNAHRVLHMSPATHLSYLVSSLRVDHLYCFWCAARYGSVEEMEGPGGCPGEEEDDH